MLAGLVPTSVLLASDFDGTLAPIVHDPAAARALPQAVDALSRLVPRLARVIILSGRSSADLRGFLPIEGLEIQGDYGLEEPTRADRRALDALAAALREPLAAGPGTWLERKPGSLTVHFRNAPEAGPALEIVASEAAAARGLRARRGRMALEITPERADKAAALEARIQALRPRAVLFAGDDTGDRGCFELVAGLEVPHLAVGVRSAEAPPGLFESCDMVVDGPAQWADMLSELADWTEAASPSDP